MAWQGMESDTAARHVERRVGPLVSVVLRGAVPGFRPQSLSPVLAQASQPLVNPLDEDAGANGRVDEYSAAGEGAEGALEDEVAELKERWCELIERIRCQRIG
jgi:hypothetical protein